MSLTCLSSMTRHPLSAGPFPVQGQVGPVAQPLKQYKLLEARKRAESAADGPDNTDFLRRSNIRVRIEHHIEAHIERAVELINRTNQLNFTKRRLPEVDLAEAARQLLEAVNGFDTQAGLVHVEDNYGDYGFVGLYVLRQTVRPGSGLQHFCFPAGFGDAGRNVALSQARTTTDRNPG